MIKINLASEQQKEKSSAKKANVVAIIISATLFSLTILATVFLGTSIFIKNTEITRVNRDIEGLKKELIPFKDLEETVLSIEAGLTALKEVTSGKYQWSYLFSHLEAATPKEVFFRKIKLNGEGAEAELSASSVDAMARFIESYKNYETIVFKGETDKKIASVSVDDGVPRDAYIKPDGKFTISVPIDLTKDHTIKIYLSITPSEVESEDSALLEAATQEGDGSAPKIINGKDRIPESKVITARYTASDRKILFDDDASEGISSSIHKLFSDVNVSEFKREAGVIRFLAKFKFDGDVIW